MWLAPVLTITPLVRAQIDRDGEASLSCEIANLTGSSVFVKSDAAPAFRSRVVLRLEDVTLHGEVALSSRDPQGFVIAFEVPRELRLTFGALIEQVEALPESAWVERTVPGPAPEEELVELNALASDLVATASPLPASPRLEVVESPWSAEPVPSAPLPERLLPPPIMLTPAQPRVVPPPVSTSPRAALPLPMPKLAASPRSATLPPVSGIHPPPAAPSPPPRMTPALLPGPGTAAPRAASTSRASSAGGLPAPGSPTADALPVLHEDQLRFGSRAFFVEHFRTQIAFGGIIARSAPRTIGSMHPVKIVVPGIASSVDVRARVGFLGDGTVGLMIDSFPVEKPRLEQLLAQATAQL